MSQSVKFWDKIADKYSRQPIADEASYQKKLKITQDYFKPDMKVLELGCGTGSTAILHSPYVKHIRAIDFSSEMIEIAKGKAEAQNIDHVTFEQLTIEELKVEDCSYDAVLGLNLLHLLENKETAITKVYQMLKPDGIFVTSTVCLGDTMQWFKMIVPMGRFFGLMPLVKVFTTKELSDILTDTGFEIDYHWQPSNSQGVFKGEFIVAKKSK